jgi:hypothetical protein
MDYHILEARYVSEGEMGSENNFIDSRPAPK